MCTSEHSQSLIHKIGVEFTVVNSGEIIRTQKQDNPD